MQYEYKTINLTCNVEIQTKRINEAAREGWELVTVSFNTGYFRRAVKNLNGRES